MTIPILKIPSEIHDICHTYQNTFSAPQFKNFERFITGIIINDKADVQALAEGFNHGAHYDSLHHFLTESMWDIDKVFERSMTMIKHLPDTARQFSPKGYLLIDDSLIEKFGKFMEGVSKLYDHSDGRYLEYAHCLVALFYIDHHGNRYPIHFDLYRSAEDCTAANVPFRTKIDIAKELIQYADRQGIPFQGVIFDSWYFCKDLVDFIENKGKNWFSQMKSNRLIRYQGKNITVSDYATTLDMRKLEKIQVDDHAYRYQSLKVSLPSLKRGKDSIRLLVSYQYDHNTKLKGPVFLVSNRKDWRVERILRTYAMRWGIESYFRDAKQHRGLGDYQVQGLRDIKRHWCLVFTSAVILELMRARLIAKQGIECLNLSVGALCQRAFNQALRSIIQWVIEQVKLFVPEQQIFTTLGG